MYAPDTTLPEPPVAEIPPAPEISTPEQLDQHWYEHVYQGDSQRQLTVRAVLMGGFLGMLMALSHMYTVLKVGFAFGVTITASVLSYVLWNAMRAMSGGRLSQMSILENNCMQSTASAAGYSTGATVASAFGALLLITGHHEHWWVLTPMVLLTAALGIFIAIPLKRQMINHEQLKFPSGIAAAETLQSLYAHGKTAMHKAYGLLCSLAVGGVVGLLRSVEGLAGDFKAAGHPQPWLETIARIAIPDSLDFPTRGGIKLAGLSFEPSVLLLGSGMLVGLRSALSMLAASAILYFGITPWLMNYDATHAGVANYVLSLPIKGATVIPVRWALWGGTSILLFSSLTSLALQWPTLARAFKRRKNAANGANDPLAKIEVPNSWLFAGLIPITIGLVVVQWFAFGISVPLGLLSVALSFVVALVCCRATGETDTTPTGAMGKVTQFIYAALPGSAGNAIINLTAAGMTASAGSSAADLLTDLKSGYLLGANSRKQFIAQFIGVFFGTAAVVPLWYLLVPNKEALETKFNPIAANMWKTVAEALAKGLHTLPSTIITAVFVGAFVGVLIPILERLMPRARKFMPSAMGLGLGFVLTFQQSLSLALGAVIAFIWTTVGERNAEKYNVPVASGLVAGESLVAAVMAVISTLIGVLLAK